MLSNHFQYSRFSLYNFVFGIDQSNFPLSFALAQPSIMSSENPVNNYTNNGLGVPTYVETTKSTNIRVTNIDPILTVEVTYDGNSTIGGAPTQTIGTIVDKMNTDWTVSSKGQAIILTASGQVITYRSESIGTYNPDGSFSDSGVMVFHLPLKMNATSSTGLYSNSTDTLFTIW